MADSKSSSTRPSAFLEEAVRLARETMNEGRGGPFGALVVRDGKIIGRGTNQVTSLRDPTAHAEILAIREACQQLNSFHLRGCEILATSEPCPMCWSAISWARLDCVYHASTVQDAAAAGFDDQSFYEELAKPTGQRNLKAVHIPLASATHLLEEWRRKVDRVNY